MLPPDTNDCGSGEKCQCVKYRFQCTQDDQACSKQEQSKNVKKWAYTILPASTCQYLKQFSSVYEDLTCCSTNRCNKPNNGKCSWSQGRRQTLRKFNDLLNF